MDKQLELIVEYQSPTDAQLKFGLFSHVKHNKIFYIIDPTDNDLGNLKLYDKLDSPIRELYFTFYYSPGYKINIKH